MIQLLLNVLPGKDSGISDESLLNRFVSIELIAPLPLLILGVVGILHPIAISLALIFALLPWGLRLWTGDLLTRPAIISGPLLLWASGAFVGLAVAYDPSLSGPAVLTLLGSIGLFFAIVNAKHLSWQISQAMVIVAALVAIYFVGQFAHFYYPLEQGRIARLGRLTGDFLPNVVFFTPSLNSVASFLEGTLLLSLVLTWQVSAYKKLFWGCLTLLIAYGLLITDSRGAWVALVVGLGLWIFLNYLRLAKMLVIIGIMVIGAGLALYLFNGNFMAPLIKFINPDPWFSAGYGRLTLYRNDFFLLTDYLFTGIGPGETFAMVYSRYQLLIPVPYMTYPHNLYLAMGLGYGLPGLAALIWLLLSLARFIIRVETRVHLPKPTSRLFRATWLGVLVIFIHGLADSAQFSEARWTMPMFFALLGLSITVGQSIAVEPSGTLKQQREGRRHGLPVAILGLVVIMAAVLPYPRALWYTNIGSVYQARADLSPDLDETERELALQQAQTHYEQALALWPTQPDSNRRMGMMALERRQFEVAVPYLEQAYRQEPHDQATLKLLGLAYLWTGQLEAAEPLLYQIDNQYILIEELGNWRNWWATQDRTDLSEAAYQMALRLYILKERAN